MTAFGTLQDSLNDSSEKITFKYCGLEKESMLKGLGNLW